MAHHMFTPDDPQIVADVARVLPSVDPTSDAFRDACDTLAALLNMETQYAGPWTDADGLVRHTSATAPFVALTSTLNPLTPGTRDPRAFDGRAGGGVPDHSAAPDQWSGQHTVKRGRNRKGATSKVLARGDAPVVGRLDCTADGLPLLAAPSTVDQVCGWDWCAARMLVTAAALPASDPNALRRHRRGWSGIGVGIITDRAAALDPEWPRMLGTDAEAWATVVPGDRSSRSPVAAQRSDLSGMTHHPTLGRFVAPEAVYGAHTSKLIWRARTRIGMRPRRTDPGRAITVRGTRIGRGVTRTDLIAFDRVDHVTANGRTRTIAGQSDTLAWTPATITALVSACDTIAVRETAPDGHTIVRTVPADRLHVGRRTVIRETSKGRTRAANRAEQARTAARTIGTVTAPATVEGWAVLIDALNRGERIVCEHDQGRVTITRGKGGKYAATDKRANREQSIRGLRTAATLAARLAD